MAAKKRFQTGLLLGQIELTEKQNNFLKIMLNPDTRIVFLSGPAGSSKAQPLDALVLTPDGFVQMGSLKVGDLISTPDGNSAKIQGVYPQGLKDIYKVSFSDGTSTECCEDHLWKTQTSYDRDYRKKKNGKRFKEAREGTIKTTRELMDSLIIRQNRLNHSIPITNPIIFKEKNFLIDPYIMGFLLGDGCLLHNICFSTGDKEIIDLIQQKLPQNYKVSSKQKEIDYSIISTDQRDNGMLNKIREYGVNVKSFEKFIPEEYLYGSIKQRLEILRGLMDSDGTIATNKRETSSHESFSTISPKLAKGVQFLVQSLGGTAKISGPKMAFYRDKDGNKVKGQDYYTVHLNFNPEFNPFLLKRKADKYVPKTKYKPHRYIIDISFVRKTEAQCISIDHPDHLYITNDFIVTHNTFLSVYAALHLYNEDKKRSICYIRTVIESASKSIGFLKGDLDQKFGPYLQPLEDKISELLNPEEKDKLLKANVLSGEPVNFIRGQDWKNRIVIGDEGQNFSIKELLTIMSRINYNTKLFICGDKMQNDIYNSGFSQCCNLFDDEESKSHGVHHLEFDTSDIMRDPVVSFIIEKIQKIL